jgi:hypothetical protein
LLSILINNNLKGFALLFSGLNRRAAINKSLTANSAKNYLSDIIHITQL